MGVMWVWNLWFSVEGLGFSAQSVGLFRVRPHAGLAVTHDDL